MISYENLLLMTRELIRRAQFLKKEVKAWMKKILEMSCRHRSTSASLSQSRLVDAFQKVSSTWLRASSSVTIPAAILRALAII